MTMKNKEHIRDALSAPPSAEYMKSRIDEGWAPVAIEWERDSSTRAGNTAHAKREVPYGVRVSEDCHHLEDDPAEQEALQLMLALIVGDKPLSKVAEELNNQGFRTRSGSSWTQVSIFRMLPRIIEVAPGILSAEEWSASKERILRAV